MKSFLNHFNANLSRQINMLWTFSWKQSDGLCFTSWSPVSLFSNTLFRNVCNKCKRPLRVTRVGSFKRLLAQVEPPSVVDLKDQLRKELLTLFDVSQTPQWSLYADNIQFVDPLNRFQGLDKYKRNISLLKNSVIFQNGNLTLHGTCCSPPNFIITRWTLEMTAVFLPWKPRICFTGISKYRMTCGKVESHVDLWDSICYQEPFSWEAGIDLLKQIFIVDTIHVSFRILRRYSHFMIVESTELVSYCDVELNIAGHLEKRVLSELSIMLWQPLSSPTTMVYLCCPKKYEKVFETRYPVFQKMRKMSLSHRCLARIKDSTVHEDNIKRELWRLGWEMETLDGKFTIMRNRNLESRVSTVNSEYYIPVCWRQDANLFQVNGCHHTI